MLLISFKTAMESSAAWKADYFSRKREGTAKSNTPSDSVSDYNIRNIHMQYGDYFSEKRNRESLWEALNNYGRLRNKEEREQYISARDKTPEIAVTRNLDVDR